jgi:hypothetical protein
MKSKKIPVNQYITDELDLTEDFYEYSQEYLSLIGTVIVYFNSLESKLDQLICNIICDRTDTTGLLVLHNMSFIAKVNLYDRLRREEMQFFNWNNGALAFNNVISKLKCCGTKRNRIVHTNWQYLDNDGYQLVRFCIGKKGLEQEFMQLDTASLKRIIEEIEKVSLEIDEFEEEFDDQCELKYLKVTKAP